MKTILIAVLFIAGTSYGQQPVRIDSIKAKLADSLGNTVNGYMVIEHLDPMGKAPIREYYLDANKNRLTKRMKFKSRRF